MFKRGVNKMLVSSTTRKVGNAVSVTLPKSLNIPINREYIIYADKKGGLSMAPKIANPFLNNANKKPIDIDDEDTRVFEQAEIEDMKHEI